MSKLNYKFSDDGFKGFLFRHGEKIVLTVAVILVAAFLYAGYSVETIPGEQTPSALLQLVNQCKSHIQNPASGLKYKEVRKPTLDHLDRVKAGRKETDHKDYYSDLGGTLGNWQILEKRADPKLFPPTRVEVVPFLSAIATRKKKGVIDPLKGLKNLPVENEMMDDMMPMGIDPGMPVDENVRKPKRKKKPEKKKDIVGRTGLSELARANIEGYRSGNESIGAAEGIDANPSIIPQGYYGVVVTALVENQRQLNEYEATLSNAKGYNAKRDQPKARLFIAQRALISPGVDPDAPGTKLNWEEWKTWTENEFFKTRQWASQMSSVMDPTYADRALTMPIPPFLMQDPYGFTRHSEVPRYLGKRSEDSETELDGSEDSPDGPSGPGSPSGPGFPGQPRFEGDIDPANDFAGPMADPMMIDPMGTEIPGMEFAANRPPAKLKMIRFFDTTVEPGKSYRYRIKVWFYDPNYVGKLSNEPMGSAGDGFGSTLSLNMLAEDVRLRLKAAAKVDRAKDPWAVFPNCRETEWSKPSPTVTIPRKVEHVLAGRILKHATPTTFNKSGIKIHQNESQLRVLSVLWNHRYSVNVPAMFDVYRGAVLNRMNETEELTVLHPTTHQFKMLPDKYQFKSNTVLLDVRGGKKLPGGTRELPIYSPGEFLIVDADGKLQTGNELDDEMGYRSFTFSDPKLQLEKEEEKEFDENDPAGGSILDIEMGPTANPRRRNRRP